MVQNPTHLCHTRSRDNNRRAFDFIFKDWSMGLQGEIASPERWARANFALNMTLSAALAVVQQLVAGHAEGHLRGVVVGELRLLHQQHVGTMVLDNLEDPRRAKAPVDADGPVDVVAEDPELHARPE